MLYYIAVSATTYGTISYVLLSYTRYHVKLAVLYLFHTLYVTILYYTILHYTILHYTILYCTILYNTLVYYTTLYCVVFLFAILNYPIR